MKDSITIVLSGEAGQGLQTVEEFLVESLTQECYVFSSKEVMSRVRGGNNSAEIRVSNLPIEALRFTIDYLFLFNNHSLERLERRLTPQTQIFGEANYLKDDEKARLNFTEVNFLAIAKEAGNRLYINTAMFGYISGLLGASKQIATEVISKRFSKRGAEVVEGNVKAFDLGYALGQDSSSKPEFVMPSTFTPKKVMTGNDALTVGALAGGANYLAAYPMSPGTTLMVNLEAKTHDFDILVEQAEDEIAALNMVIGAWYAGARALTTTSGGGFALMTEAVSLAGITESPAVVHIAQRPGPATGLPTRTEQGDLNLVLYAGHGEFPRVMFAPGRIQSGIELMSRAFYMADKYQIPAFVLSDQYWLESLTQVDELKLNPTYLESFITKTDKDYKRYAFTQESLSPRGIPGFGEGFVKVDSDEHDEEGMITESFDMRNRMHEKRLNKFELMKEDVLSPTLEGSPNLDTLIIGWGSTYGVIKEVVEAHPNWSHLHFEQVFPLPESVELTLRKAKKIVVVENNATGQFANLLQMTFAIKLDQRVMKYSGEPFHVDELTTLLEERVA
jgi:2-oxoglutarate/2-oxoacid ferredoxin oxidoreductase subunit alpha